MEKMVKIRDLCQKHDYLVLIIGTIIYELAIYFFNNTLINTLIYITGIVLLLFNKKKIHRLIFYFIYIIGVIIRTSYILNIDIYMNQHDVGSIYIDGHLGYIYTIFNTLKLPGANTYQFYHPPFWHIIAALWLKFNTFLKIDFDMALEGIQIITLLLSSFIIIITDKIVNKLKFDKIYCLFIDMAIAINTTLIIFSGGINNDCLLTFLEFLIIYLLIIWNELPSWKNTIILAITTGLCVMTKASGSLMAVPIIYIFISKLVNDIKHNKANIKSLVIKILSFGMISLPIGLWFEVRSIIMFDTMPVVPAPELFKITNSIIDKFFSINFEQLINYKNIIDDFNLPAHLIKTATIGEWPYEHNDVILTIFIICNLLLLVNLIVFIIKYLFKDRKNIFINTFLIIWVINVISINIFYYKYPYICSMDFRYIAICMLPSNIILAYSLNAIKKNCVKIPIIVFYMICFVFNIVFVLKYF